MTDIKDPEFIDLIRERLRYEPNTGELIWISRPKNSPQLVGQVAGTTQHANRGYRSLSIKRKRLYAHQVAYLLYYGYWALANLDHKNGDTADNRIDNLRPATIKQNAANSKKGKRGRYLKGVIYESRAGKFIARIRVDGANMHLGTYATEEEAHAAYVNAAKRYFGEFARAA